MEPACCVRFVRPERYTYQFMERSKEFTLSFFTDRYRPALNICGSKSGRDCNKIAEASLTPLFTESGNPAFSEARLVLECRKLYADLLSKEAFIDREPFAVLRGKSGFTNYTSLK